MAGAGWRAFTRQILSSAQVQTYLMDQVLQKYASSAARTAAIPAPDDGMASVLLDGHGVPDVRIGGVWRPVSSPVDAAATSTAIVSASNTDTRVAGTQYNRTLDLKAGRLYRVTVTAAMDADTSGAGGELRVRGKAGGTPVSADPCVAFSAAVIGTPTRPQHMVAQGCFGVTTSGSHTLSVFARRLHTTGTITIGGASLGTGTVQVELEDQGAYVSGYPQL